LIQIMSIAAVSGSTFTQPAVSASPIRAGGQGVSGMPGQVPDLSAAAAPTYRVLQGGGGLPASATPSFVLPANGRGFLALFNALQAIAVEHVYPAPVFSFSA
jgi:hypothetical protein